ncbi:hypothetical protein [Halegenticoccus soli]|uniref:hypothetical protein n=1 Tax=Halegenticoccus soli TaxID=1985678 RepID=UPI000C6E160E|nr:hypothetical protein [Halegenticoccus soli]
MTEHTRQRSESDFRAPRRRFMRAVGGIGAAVGLAGLGSAQEGGAQSGSQQGGGQNGQQPTTYVLGGLTEHWVGLSPVVDAFHRQENPPLKFQPGEQYRVVWINLDGANHEFQILNRGGEELVATESTANVGEARSVDFRATQEMARYRCEYHPQTMIGDVQIGSEYATPTPAQTPSGNESGGGGGY